MNHINHSTAGNHSTADNAPRIDLTTCAVLSKLTVKSWKGQKQDRQATTELAQDKQAQRKAIAVQKRLVSLPELAELTKFEAAARRTHDSFTRPMMGGGWNALHTSKMPECIQATDEQVQKHPQIVDKFITAYSTYINSSAVRQDLGQLFNIMDYPSPEYLRTRFHMSHDIIPIAESSDFRIQVAMEQRAALQEHYEKHMARKHADLCQGIFEDLHKQLTHIIERLDWSDLPEGKTKKSFHGTLLTNLEAIVSSMETWNINNDPAMAQTTQSLRAALQGLTPDTLKNNSVIRERVLATAKQQLHQTKRTLGW